MSYRDYLARRHIQPLQIERTPKFGGDVVLDSWARPVSTVPAHVRPHGERGRFVGRAR